MTSPIGACGGNVINLLGVSYGFHDAAAAVVVDGRVLAAVEEERLSRIKHDPAFPERAIAACLDLAGLGPDDIDAVCFHEKPLDVLHRHLTTRVRSGPAALRALLLDTPDAARSQLTVGHVIARWFADRGVREPVIHFVEHHVSHAAAAFYPSGFDEAAVMTVDGVGEWATATLGDGRGARLTIDRELRFPDSLGLLYSAFTAYCGFRVNGGEGELMGLAPFGTPRYAEQIRSELVDIRSDGSFGMDQRAFAYLGGRRMVGRRFERMFGGPARPLGSEPTQREADLAASVQVVTEEILLAMAGELHARTGWSALCLAGGVALNCVANGRLLRDSPFDELWVQPAAGDAGSAVGAAMYVWHHVLDQPRVAEPGDAMSGAFLGPSWSPDEVEAWLTAEGVEHRVIADPTERCDEVARRLADGAVVGWFCGRMEFGPRALGHRSILADPRSPTVQERVNAMVKERAAFRPFAPAVLAERVGDWFDPVGVSPYMTSTTSILPERWGAAPDDEETVDEALSPAERVRRARGEVPAVTHVDGSARCQLVDPATNPEFAEVLAAFERLTGCPVLLNTSFNARDEPIVCSPSDALATFRRTGLDLLVLEHCIVEAG